MFLRDAAVLVEVFNCRHTSSTYRVIVESRHLFYVAARESGAREYLTAKIDCQASEDGEQAKVLFKNAPRVVDYSNDLQPAVTRALGQLAVRRIAR